MRYSELTKEELIGILEMNDARLEMLEKTIDGIHETYQERLKEESEVAYKLGFKHGCDAVEAD